MLLFLFPEKHETIKIQISLQLFSSNFLLKMTAVHFMLTTKYRELECGPMPNVMVALPNGALFNAAEFG